MVVALMFLDLLSVGGIVMGTVMTVTQIVATKYKEKIITIEEYRRTKCGWKSLNVPLFFLQE